MNYVRDSARLTVFLWIWSEKARALVAWSAVRRPPLVYALAENKEAEESDLQHENSPSDGIHNYFLQWVMLPLPCPTHQSSLCLCQSLPLSSPVKDFPQDLQLPLQILQAWSEQPNQGEEPMALTCSYHYKQHNSCFCQNRSLQKGFL